MAGAERITWVGHATVSLEIGGARLLTDPVLRPRVAHLRRHGPRPDPHVLAGLDAVLVSHLHLDHLDVPSLRMLGRIRRRGVAAQMGDPRPEDRIGEQPRAADLERHGGVPDPGDPLRAGHAHTLREPRASAPHPRG